MLLNAFVWLYVQWLLRVSIYYFPKMFGLILHTFQCNVTCPIVVRVFPDYLVLHCKTSTSCLVRHGAKTSCDCESVYMLHWTHRFRSAQRHANRQRQVYRMILARCILSFAGYGPCDKKAFLTARPAHGKLWEQDWYRNNNIKIVL